jgi:hypothetical protein
MGANWIEFIPKIAVNDRDSLMAEYKTEKRRDEYDHGHSYSGGFAMTTGLIIDNCLPFDSYQNATDYLRNTCKKWEEARAVRYVEQQEGRVRWLIGAWCAS